MPGRPALWAVPGLRPLGDGSLLGEGYPFCLRGSGGAIPGGAPSNDGSSRDLSDRCDCASSRGGPRPGLKLAGKLPESGVRGRPANSEFEDCGVKLRDANCGGIGLCPWPGRGRILSPLGRERMLGSIDRFWRRSGIDGATETEFGMNGGGLRASSPVLGLPKSSGRPGLLGGPPSSPGGLRKFGFAPGGSALPSDIGGDSPGLLGGGPGDFGGIGL